MSITKEEIDEARALVGKVLSGEVTPSSESVLFEEDMVLFNVRAVERYDPQWLLDQLADGRYPLSGRREVLNNMRFLHEAGCAILKRAEEATEE